ncbi:MAG: hypothetical protein ACXV3F_11060 [Frankiaceae bacterium]
MRRLKRDRSVGTVVAGHAFHQNVRHGHYEFAVDVLTCYRLLGRVLGRLSGQLVRCSEQAEKIQEILSRQRWPGVHI